MGDMPARREITDSDPLVAKFDLFKKSVQYFGIQTDLIQSEFNLILFNSKSNNLYMI
jgi:hypothetical protein